MGADAVGAAVEALDELETIARLCLSASVPIVDNKYPNQIDPETGFIRLEEISHRELRRGFSVQRLHLYSLKDALQMVADRKARKLEKGIVADYLLAGVLLCKVTEVHVIGDAAGTEVFQVLPKPLDGQPGHAEIHFKSPIKKEDFLEHRLALQRALGKLVDASILDAAA